MSRFEHPQARYQMIFNPEAGTSLRDQAGSDQYLHHAVIATVDAAMIKPIVWWVDAEQRGLRYKDRTERVSDIQRRPDGSVHCVVEFNGSASQSIAQKAALHKTCPGMFVAEAVNDLYRGDDLRSRARVYVVPIAPVAVE